MTFREEERLYGGDDCTEACAVHAPDCDGYCDHFVNHTNACLHYGAIHATGYDSGYSAAIHDARVPGSRAYAELAQAVEAQPIDPDPLDTDEWDDDDAREGPDEHDACPIHEEPYRICGCPVPAGDELAAELQAAVASMPPDADPGGGDIPIDAPILALYFTPDAIRDHFEYDPRVTLASDERLRRVGLDALQADYIYEAFHDALVAALENEGIRA